MLFTGLAGNRLESVPYLALFILMNLQTLDLRQNSISELHTDDFQVSRFMIILFICEFYIFG